MKTRFFSWIIVLVALSFAPNYLKAQERLNTDSRWSLGGFYRAKATYLLSLQNSLCGGDCDYLFWGLPGGELGLNAMYAIQPTLGVNLEASWAAHGYSYRGTFTNSTVTGERITPQYSVAGRYLLIAPSVVLQEADSTGFAWKWTAGIGLGIPLGITVAKADIAEDGTLSGERYSYPTARFLEPLVDIRLGTIIPLAWKGLHITAGLNYNVNKFFKWGDSAYGNTLEQANALGATIGVQYLMPLSFRR